MTTSYSRTREEVRDMVLRKLRVLGVDRTPEAEEEAIVLEALDLRLKELHRLGINWWKVSSTVADVSLTSAVATASAPADILIPITLNLRIDAEDYPIDIVDHRIFQRIETKTDTGQPEKAVLFDGVFRFHPIPDIAYTAKLTYQKIVDDTAGSTAPDVPVECLRWLKDLVAYDVSDDFRVPEQRVVRYAAEAQRAEKNIRALIPQKVDSQPVEFESF